MIMKLIRKEGRENLFFGKGTLIHVLNVFTEENRGLKIEKFIDI